MESIPLPCPPTTPLVAAISRMVEFHRHTDSNYRQNPFRKFLALCAGQYIFPLQQGGTVIFPVKIRIGSFPGRNFLSDRVFPPLKYKPLMQGIPHPYVAFPSGQHQRLSMPRPKIMCRGPCQRKRVDFFCVTESSPTVWLEPGPVLVKLVGKDQVFE
jgi:hypothetical protein